jgi:hypothetical protein
VAVVFVFVAAIRRAKFWFLDCFLLTFHYAKPLNDQNILIDFGSVGGKADMKGIAADIKEACGGRLYAVVEIISALRLAGEYS